MGKKNVFVDVPSLYKKQALDLIMYGYVHGIQTAMPSVSVREAIKIFAEKNDLDEAGFSWESAQTAFFRMRADFNCGK
jgi:hypothetical protein